MPRMSKKRKQEWALFLNERNRITYNGLCRKCSNDCKQSFQCIVVHCPKYLSKRRTKNNEANLIKDISKYHIGSAFEGKLFSIYPSALFFENFRD